MFSESQGSCRSRVRSWVLKRGRSPYLLAAARGIRTEIRIERDPWNLIRFKPAEGAWQMTRPVGPGLPLAADHDRSWPPFCLLRPPATEVNTHE